MNAKALLSLFCLVTAGLIISLTSCEKEITVDLPASDDVIVVEGSIFQGEAPIVMLTRSQGYFDPTSFEVLQNFFVHGAQVVIETNGVSYPLVEICSSDLDSTQLAVAAEALGVPVSTIVGLNLCLYSSFDLVGVPNTEYKLRIEHDGDVLTSSTKIPGAVPLDTVFFQIFNPDPADSLGFLTGIITDPDTTGNAYRWFARRINKFPQWVANPEKRGRVKDFGFIAPLGSVNDDRFFNGLQFEFSFYRGSEANSTSFDDLNNERGFFKRGDTVVVRSCTIDRNSYKYLYSFESQVSNQGSPFAVPFNLQTNINGGFGAFIGYATSFDTVYCD
ncbi:MAG: DUF4249 domain-containing protein [Flavobacteriales bacterium]